MSSLQTETRARDAGRLVVRVAHQRSFITLFPRNADPVLYRVEGFFELAFSGSESACSIPVVNLRATRAGLPGTGPTRLHFRSALDANAGGSFTRAGGGRLSVPLEMTYPALDRDAADGPHGVPLPARFMPMTAQFDLAPSRDLPNCVGMGLAPEFGPHFDGAVPVDFDMFCEIDDAPRCLSLCVRIWVANDANRQPILTRQRVDAILAEANRIWGCDGGQCCIRFTMRGNPAHPGVVGDDITLRKGNQQDLATLTGNFRRNHGHRDGRCHDIYLLGSIRTNGGMIAEYGALGVTLGGVPGGTVVHSIDQATGQPYSDASLGSTVAHELGHAMGLGGGAANDPNGVSGHSPKANNLMKKDDDPTLPDAQIRANTQLNRRQCDRARGDRRLRETDDSCTLAPLEQPPA